MHSSQGVAIRQRVLDARRKLGLSQQEVADWLTEHLERKVSRQMVSKWEHGDSTPDLRALGELCILYGVTPNWIVCGTEVETEVLAILKTAKSGA